MIQACFMRLPPKSIKMTGSDIIKRLCQTYYELQEYQV